MLEIIEFNSNLFRYRSESTELGIIYSLRYGTIFLVKGNAKTIIERTISKGRFSVNIDNKAINFLIQNKILLRKVKGNES